MLLNDFLHLEADAITENPVIIPFAYDNITPVPEGEELGNTITIAPMTVETWFRLKPLIAEISPEDYNNLLNRPNAIPDMELINLLDKYDSILMQIVFIGIHNKPGEMSDWRKQALISNFSWQDIHILLNAVLFRIGHQSFYKSITTLRNVSPWSEAEIIAAQKNLESWKIVQ